MKFYSEVTKSFYDSPEERHRKRIVRLSSLIFVIMEPLVVLMMAPMEID